jgi:hypothetical protein
MKSNISKLLPAKHENTAALAEFRKRKKVGVHDPLNVVVGGNPCVIEYDGFQYDVQETTNSATAGQPSGSLWSITERQGLISFPIGHELFAVTGGNSIIPISVTSVTDVTDVYSDEPFRNLPCFDIKTTLIEPYADLPLIDRVAYKTHFDTFTHFAGRYIGDCVSEPIRVFTTLVDAKACLFDLLRYQKSKLRDQLRNLQVQQATVAIETSIDDVNADCASTCDESTDKTSLTYTFSYTKNTPNGPINAQRECNFWMLKPTLLRIEKERASSVIVTSSGRVSPSDLLHNALKDTLGEAWNDCEFLN